MSQTFNIPENLARTRIEMHGSEGEAWVRSLPTILADCERRWSLTVGSPFPRLSYNYAAQARRVDGTPLVVKVCYPDREVGTEAEALRLYSGQGAVQLLDYEPDWGVLLLESLEPGAMLLSVEDDERATHIAAEIMKQLWRPAPANHPFPTIADWEDGFTRLREAFGGGSGPFSEELVDTAERLFSELLASASEPVVLHGDLHHFNILSAVRQPWLAIDPKGVVGERAYETGALLRNPMPELYSWPQLGRTLARRIDQLAEELQLDRARIKGWGLAQAVLSAWWSYEDEGHGWEGAIAVAELLAQ